MPWTSIFFNPTLRVNVLQLLLLSLTLPVNLAIASFSTGNVSLRSLILTIGAAFFILLHHVASLFLSRFSGVIIVDWLLLVFESAGVGFTIFRISGLSLLALPTLIALIIMLSFRTATVLASPDRLWEQKLEFWGGCRATHRSPWMVLLNRPLGSRLLGESIFAIIVRCVILIVIGISLPVLGVNKIFFQPSRASVYSRPQSNAFPMSMSVSDCPTFPTTLSNLPGLAIENLFTVATCPVTWADIDRMNVSITFSPFGVPYGIYPGMGDFNDIVMFTQPILVLADFNLFAYMTWTNRQLVSTHSGFLSLFNAFLPGRNVQHMEVHSLLSAPGSGPTTTTSTPSASDILKGIPESTTTVNMAIVQRESLATKFVQDYTDATAL
ncbi:hypothetical protein B0H17DRAFT_1061339 [Mycena rosella]|uniref:Transmembrane protein n=1 Tax=Mycena rosella TaxID=1033263 RepID=A0AAD7DJX4_MYCRO|nr:hypothetical protein B0H17DRAFT_1061339 [Mycena rosella]